jgi:hypothetical protein
MPVDVMGCRYPTNFELRRLQADLLNRPLNDRLGLQILPVRNTDRSSILNNKPDIFRGMTQWRGVGQPTKSANAPFNYFGRDCIVHPGYWGEHCEIPEDLLNDAAAPASCGAPVDISDYVSMQVEKLTNSQLNLMEYLVWQVLLNGYVQAQNAQGQPVWNQTFNIRKYTVGTPWSDPVGATPLADLRRFAACAIGKCSADFQDSVMYVNQHTMNCLLNNRNPNDIGKNALSACCTPMSPDLLNNSLAAQGLPRLRVYNGFWIDANNQVNMYIPTGKAIVIGRRPDNAPVGNWWYTRNVIGCDVTSGPWMRVIDSCADNTMSFDGSRRIRIFNGFNGTPALDYPCAVWSIDTGCTEGSCS